MDASRVKIDGVRLDIILRHYKNLGILVSHAVKTRELGGNLALDKWDSKRSDKTCNYDVEIVIEELSVPVTFK